MNRITRMLTIAGIGLAVGLTVSTAPAAAATSSTQGATKSSTVSPFGRDRVVGYYDTVFECNRAGRIGERFGRWDDYDCYRVRWGWHRGDWALEVSWDHGWPGHGWPGHGWPGRPGGPGWPGHPGHPGGPGPWPISIR